MHMFLFHLQILYDVHCFTTSCTPSNGAFFRRASSQLELPPDAGSTSGSPSPNKFLGRTSRDRQLLGFLGKASNQTGCRGQVLCIGYLWIFVSWFCNLGYFVVWSPSFLVFNTRTGPVTQGTWDVFQLTLLGGKVYWCFSYTWRS